jgi:hypothetical protein
MTTKMSYKEYRNFQNVNFNEKNKYSVIKITKLASKDPDPPNVNEVSLEWVA